MLDSKEITARAIAAYKSLLRRALDSRPSGTRLKLAAALGTNRSFVSQMEKNADSMSIIRAVIALGKSLRIKVTAEGVTLQTSAPAPAAMQP